MAFRAGKLKSNGTTESGMGEGGNEKLEVPARKKGRQLRQKICYSPVNMAWGFTTNDSTKTGEKEPGVNLPKRGRQASELTG